MYGYGLGCIINASELAVGCTLCLTRWRTNGGYLNLLFLHSMAAAPQWAAPSPYGPPPRSSWYAQHNPSRLASGEPSDVRVYPILCRHLSRLVSLPPSFPIFLSQVSDRKPHSPSPSPNTLSTHLMSQPPGGAGCTAFPSRSIRGAAAADLLRLED